MIYLNEQRIITNETWSSILNTLVLFERLKSAKTISVKPNFAAGTYANPEAHVISDLTVLTSLINYISSVNPVAIIYIAESDSTGYGFAYMKFENLRIPQGLDLTEQALSQVKTLDMSRDRLILIEDKAFKYFMSIDTQLWLSEKFMKSDFKISLSNLKTHSVTNYTGACKNLFGCLPETDKSVYHPYIHKVIHDLTLAIKPDLNIVDAFYGMEQNGPVQGFDIDTGYRVFSDSAVQVDIYASQTAGLKPTSVRYIKYLMSATETEFILVDRKENMKSYKKPQFFLRIMNRIGLRVQKIGNTIANFGHRVHTCYTPMILIIAIARPILLKIFDYETLKTMKRKIVK